MGVLLLELISMKASRKLPTSGVVSTTMSAV